MIHNGLQLYFKQPGTVLANHCCLRGDLFSVDPNVNFWNDSRFMTLRNTNQAGHWDPGCSNCQRLETIGSTSFRQGTLDMFGQDPTLSGPKRLDLMFDISCNLACRTCGPSVSTFWQRHLRDHGEWSNSIDPLRRSTEVIDALSKLDLSNLRLVVFCGGETLLGSAYWEVANAIADMVPDAKKNLTLSFQTNGTQSIAPGHYATIERFHLVKLNISIDAVGPQFNYLRWPADFDQVISNVKELTASVPSNVMFLVEETVSIFNLADLTSLEQYLQENLATNREGDVVDHTRHLANGIFSLDNLTQEYYDYIKQTPWAGLLPYSFKENPLQIEKMISNIKLFDQRRQQSWQEYFPEVVKFYSRYL